MLPSLCQVVAVELTFPETNVVEVPFSLVILEYNRAGLRLKMSMKTTTKNYVDSTDDDDDDWNCPHNNVAHCCFAAIVLLFGDARIALFLAF